MDLHQETTYDADPPAVFGMLTDEEFLTRWVTSGHALRHEVSVSRTAGGGAHTRTWQSLPAEIPDFARRFVGPTVDLDQVIEWRPPEPDGSHNGDVRIDVAKAPVTMRGKIRLERHPAGSGTRQLVDVTIKASVPLVGRKLEEASAPAILAALEGQEQLGREWLAGLR